MRKWLVCSSMTVIMLTFCGGGRSAQAAQTSTSMKMVNPCHIEQAGVFHALAEISKKANVAIGVEAILPREEPTIIIDFPGGTVADLLNAFAAQAPDYAWTDGGRGVIHVSRNTGRIPLLDVVIAYPGADKKTRQQIWEDLAKRPEVSAWFDSARCTRGELFQGGEFRNHNEVISIARANITLEQLFDEVTLKSGENFWAVLQSPPSGSSCRVALILW
jgi:hypothetical protein